MGIFDGITVNFYTGGTKNNVPYSVARDINSKISDIRFVRETADMLKEASLDNICFSKNETETVTTDEDSVMIKEISNLEGKHNQVINILPDGGKKIIIYDENGHLKTIEILKPDGSRIFADYIDQEKFLKYFDSNGKLTKEETFWNNGKKRERLYDENENMPPTKINL